jgi:hypothetical protein
VWITAVAVHDFDEALRVAVEAGGTAPGESVDIPTLGRFHGCTIRPEPRSTSCGSSSKTPDAPAASVPSATDGITLYRAPSRLRFNRDRSEERPHVEQTRAQSQGEVSGNHVSGRGEPL